MADPYAGLHEDFSPRLQQLQDVLRQQYGLETEVESGLRSNERQAQLYAQGRTAPGPIVTYAQPGSSYHNYGAAVDLRPTNMSESQAARIVKQAIAENPDLGVRGIGDWDPFHVQLGVPLGTLRAGGVPAQPTAPPFGVAYPGTVQMAGGEAAPLGGASPGYPAQPQGGLLNTASVDPRVGTRPNDTELAPTMGNRLYEQFRRTYQGQPEFAQQEPDLSAPTPMQKIQFPAIQRPRINPMMQFFRRT